MTPPIARGPWNDAAQAAITSELVRLSLGGRGPRRPELVAPLVDFVRRRTPPNRRPFAPRTHHGRTEH